MSPKSFFGTHPGASKRPLGILEPKEENFTGPRTKGGSWTQGKALRSETTHGIAMAQTCGAATSDPLDYVRVLTGAEDPYVFKDP